MCKWPGILLLGLALCLSACAAQDRNEGDEVNDTLSHEELAKGNNSSVQAESMRVVRDRESFETVWRQAGQERELPDVDFDREMVVAVFMGERRTGGYSTEVEEISREGDTLRIRVRMQSPGEGCMTTQALTRPFQLVRLSRTDEDVEFEVNAVEVDC